MSLLGLVGGRALAKTVAKTPAEPQLLIGESLACGRRLWVRGRLLNSSAAGSHRHDRSAWWQAWRRRPDRLSSPTSWRLETRVNGHLFTRDLSLDSLGRFEVKLEADLPAARRGWRIARNRLTDGSCSVEKCSVVLLPPEKARGAVAVILPVSFSFTDKGVQHFSQSSVAAEWSSSLRQLEQKPGGYVFYYLACVPEGTEGKEAELALAASALGWPHGTFLAAPCKPGLAAAELSGVLQGLRWLLAGSLEIQVLNLEPSFGKPLLDPVAEGEQLAKLEWLSSGSGTNGQTASAPPKASSLVRVTGRIRAGAVPRYPVVFCHGMLAFTSIWRQLPEDWNSFWPLREFLRARGFQAYFPQVAPTASVAARAAELRAQILRWTDGPVNLVAHSMGGLDARYLITHLNMAEQVRSLTTVSTPHRGTYLVDWFFQNYNQRVPLFLALEALGFNGDGFRDCRPIACRAFNERTHDMPGVAYFSYGGDVPAGRVTAPLRRAWSLRTSVEGPSDGMVSLASARWGEHLGTVRADHFAQTPDMTVVHPAEDFDALGFYVHLLENLARRGF